MPGVLARTQPARTLLGRHGARVKTLWQPGLAMAPWSGTLGSNRSRIARTAISRSMSTRLDRSLDIFEQPPHRRGIGVADSIGYADFVSAGLGQRHRIAHDLRLGNLPFDRAPEGRR